MSIEAEQAVLGGILIKPESYWLVADLLNQSDFRLFAHGKIYAAVGEMLAGSRPVDVITVGEYLSGKRELNEVGDTDYLIKLASETPSAANIRGWAEIVSKASEKRRLEVAARGIAVADTFAEAQRILAEVSPKSTAKLLTAKDAAKQMAIRLDERYFDDGSLRGISSGIDTIDKVTGGYRGGQLIVVAGRPGMGKSLKIVQMAKECGRCLVFTMEMPADELMERMLSNMFSIPNHWLRFPKKFENELYGDGTLSIKIAKMNELKCVFDDRASPNLNDIIATARQQHMIEPLKAVVIDHLGLITLPQRERHDLAVGAVTKELKILAKELDIPVILLSQLSRKVEDRADKRPLLSDLRNSGDIEQDADIVILMFRPEYYQMEPRGYVEFIIAKHRNGETGSVFAETRMANMQFFGCEPPAYQSPQKSVPQRGGFIRDR